MEGWYCGGFSIEEQSSFVIHRYQVPSPPNHSLILCHHYLASLCQCSPGPSGLHLWVISQGRATHKASVPSYALLVLVKLTFYWNESVLNMETNNPLCAP